MNNYCIEYIKKFQNGNIQEKNKILNLINDKMKIMEKGIIDR